MGAPSSSAAVIIQRMSAPAHPDRVTCGGSVGGAALTSATMIVGIDRLAPPTERPINIKIIYFPVGGSYLLRDRRKRPLHMLVEGFDVFGVHVQYWMPVAVVIIVVAIIFEMRSR